MFLLVLVGDDQTGDRGRGERGEDARDKGGERQAGDVGRSLGRKLTKDTDLDTERANVAEAAARVRGDETRSGGETGVLGAGGQSRKGVVFVLLAVSNRGS